MGLRALEIHVQNNIDRLGLLRRSSPVLVALSGGADSVALLSVLTALGYDCIAAHCNFHLRGEESNRDMRHAQAIAAKLDVNIYIREFDVQKRMKTTGESVEMACRELRYAWFHDLLDRDYSQAIAVGHHREDNVETFFINLLRSSGIAGLTGMDFRRGFVVRPMLDVSRTEIEEYLRECGLEYVTDRTNAENDFRRNRLRNVVIPELERNFPGASDAILAAMGHLGKARHILEHAVERFGEEIGMTSESMDVARLLERHGNVLGAEILFEMLKPMGLNASQTSDIVRAVETGASGLRFDVDTVRFAELDRGILSLHNRVATPSNAEHPVSLTHDVLTPVNIQVTPHNILEFKPERDPFTMYLDMSVLAANGNFALRHPRTGDRIKPYGMTTDKLVSDILKDAKFSSADKRNVWLLTHNDVILWIVGLRASAHFALTPETRRYLRLRYVPDVEKGRRNKK